jgi:uncharacterized protein YegJ (DUF2314 family)
MKTYWLFLFLILLLSCAKPKKINVQGNNFVYGIGIYFLDSNSLNLSEYETLTKLKFSDFQKTNNISELTSIDVYSIKIEKPSDEFTPPDTNSIDQFGRNLSKMEKLQLQKYKNVLSFVFRGLPTANYEKQKRINDYIYELVKDKNVVIADFNSYEWFNPQSWFEKRLTNFNDTIKDIVNQIAVHLYRNDEFCRAVTMGMDKFGLPDVSIKDFSCSNSNAYSNLINVVVQTLAENTFVNKDSSLNLDLNSIKNKTLQNAFTADLKVKAKKKASIKLKLVKPDEGDNNNKQFQIVFVHPDFKTPQEEQEKTISDLFGAENAIKYVSHDALLLDASKRAKARLPELRKLFCKGLEPGYAILLKAPFKTLKGTNEWMWVEITKWTSESITGILQNEPYEIKNLKAGAIVTVYEKDIFDYLLYKPDGSSEGNETGEIINKSKE